MTTKEKAMPDVRDPAEWVDDCPECLCRNNTPLVVEVGTRPGSIRCHYTCQECRGTWRTEYVDTNGDRLIISYATRPRWGTDYGMAPAAVLLGGTTEDTTEAAPSATNAPSPPGKPASNTLSNRKAASGRPTATASGAARTPTNGTRWPSSACEPPGDDDAAKRNREAVQ